MTLLPHPDPDQIYPMQGYPHLVYLKNVITRPNIQVGAFTYFDATALPGERPEAFQSNNVLYHFDFLGDTLRIGRFCALASGVRFLMNGANHALSGLSTYPFGIFGGTWADRIPVPKTSRGDMVVGHDVWIGFQAQILPGVRIGHGAVVGAGSVVTREVAPYHVVAGNPARVVRKRFSEQDMQRLLRLAWWDWPVERITACLPAIVGNDVAALEACGEA